MAVPTTHRCLLPCPPRVEDGVSQQPRMAEVGFSSQSQRFRGLSGLLGKCCSRARPPEKFVPAPPAPQQATVLLALLSCSSPAQASGRLRAACRVGSGLLAFIADLCASFAIKHFCALTPPNPPKKSPLAACATSPSPHRGRDGSLEHFMPSPKVTQLGHSGSRNLRGSAWEASNLIFGP